MRLSFLACPALSVLALWLSTCGGSQPAGRQASGGNIGSGGWPLTGGTGSGGTVTSTGGVGTVGGAAGAAPNGTGGLPGSGGVGTGGSAGSDAASAGGTAGRDASATSTGGSTSGGTGGAGTGGATVGGTGGSATGGRTGVGTGGSATGGRTGVGTGGAATGGAAGVGSGGAPGTGGAATVKLIGFATLNGGTKGGLGGETVTATTFAQLKSYAESATAYIIMVQGTISNGAAGGKITVKSNKSIVGVGSTAFLSGIGLDINNANNIIVQNLKLSLVGTSTPSGVNGGDVIGIAGTSKNIWIDHCELFAEDPDVQTDKDLYDGLIDIKAQTGFITISWCYLHDHHKGGLVGAADDDLFADRKVTFHHNYYNKVKLRVPMYRGATGHFFNNYIVGATDASEIRADTCVRVEKNYYEALHYSIYTPADSPGQTERIDNVEVSRTTRAYPANCTADIPYTYADVLTTTTNDVKTVVPLSAGVGRI